MEDKGEPFPLQNPALFCDLNDWNKNTYWVVKTFSDDMLFFTDFPGKSSRIPPHGFSVREKNTLQPDSL